MFVKGKKAEGFQQTAYSLSPDATDIIPGIFYIFQILTGKIRTL